jgi:hypothetical protein
LPLFRYVFGQTDWMLRPFLPCQRLDYLKDDVCSIHL